MKFLGALISAALLALLCGAPANAQVADPDVLYERAEDLRTEGDDPEDIEAAIALYRLAAAEGKKAAHYRLGQLYLSQGEADAALAALARSAAFGSTGAALLLAEGHATGAFGPRSDARLGVPVLEEIADRPDGIRAKLLLADLYADGLGVPADPRRALALYEEAARSGDARALRALGRQLSAGRIVEADTAGAVELLERSVAAGSLSALRDLGLALVAEGRGTEARAVFERAVAQGVPGAAAELANAHYRGHFGTASDRKGGASELRRLAEAGDVRAARYALRHHERKSRRIVELDLERVLAELDTQAQRGDAFAASVLARSYRTLHWLIPDNRARHAALIGQYPHLFERDNLLAERIWAAYDPYDHRASWDRAWALLDASQGDGFSEGLLRLRTIEQRAYVYALQRELAAIGVYTGRIDGFANRTLIGSLLDYCRSEGIGDICKHGPFQYNASLLIARALEARRKSDNAAGAASGV